MSSDLQKHLFAFSAISPSTVAPIGMFDSTAQLLAARPVAVPAFLASLWLGYRAMRRYWTFISAIALYVAGVALLPLFGAFFLAVFFDRPVLYTVADGIRAAEAWLVELGIRFLDALFFALLKVFIIVLTGLWAVTRDLAATFVPVLTPHEFLVTVFGFEYLAGGTLIYALYYTAQDSAEQHWLSGVGIVLGVAGGFATIIKTGVWQLSRDTLLSGFIAGVLGLALGVATIILVVQPNFGRAPMFDALQGGAWRDSTAERVDRVRNRVTGWFRAPQESEE